MDWSLLNHASVCTSPSRAHCDWMGKISPSCDPALPESRWLFWPVPLSICNRPSPSSVISQSQCRPPPTQRGWTMAATSTAAVPTQRQGRLRRFRGISKQVVGGQEVQSNRDSSSTPGSWGGTVSAPGSGYGDLLYRGPQNIPSYQNDLNAGAWEGERSPSIILKINPPLHSSPESINNVARGENLRQRFILILWLLFISL